MDGLSRERDRCFQTAGCCHGWDHCRVTDQSHPAVRSPAASTDRCNQTVGSNRATDRNHVTAGSNRATDRYFQTVGCCRETGQNHERAYCYRATDRNHERACCCRGSDRYHVMDNCCLAMDLRDPMGLEVLLSAARSSAAPWWEAP